jgi:hypothetical protein
MTEDRGPAYNSVLPQLVVTCKIDAECYYQTFVQVDSEVHRNLSANIKFVRFATSLNVTVKGLYTDPKLNTNKNLRNNSYLTKVTFPFFS